jgi:DNA-binding response OmpR family regulator
MTARQRILVVDDNETNRDILDARLTANGYDVLHAGDGEEALAAAREHVPDLILLDIMMPKINGLDVCRQLKAEEGLPFIPIVLVTAKADSEDVVHGLEAGADEYLTKPIDQKTLVARVKALLRLKSLNNRGREQAKPRSVSDIDVFLSYAREDAARIRELAALLQQSGLKIWWDSHIRVGESFDRAIEDALTKAGAVIVAWSRHSVDSDWVRAEAAYAFKKSKLLPVRLDDAVLPLRFMHTHTLNMSAWDGSCDDQAYRRLIADLSGLLSSRQRD